MSKSLLVNVYGASGVGKTITATALVNALKMKGVNAEYCREWVKEEILVSKLGTGSNLNLSQKDITENQLKLLDSYMASGADVVVTDSPLLTGKLYGSIYGDWNPELEDLLMKHLLSNIGNTVDVLLLHKPSGVFQEFGRLETQAESIVNQRRLKSLLSLHSILPVSFTLEEFMHSGHNGKLVDEIKRIVEIRRTGSVVGE